ncbi:hypothetical protein [Roseicitreum antarcticum]|uniref:Pre-peptidase C-terminal domain-containing protein n=1 Tax=Roseicitreum antarcticum TaxID=564137 RepID=A0A1H2VQ07_9RHOB|nr:hypothetical protein [Roseicitreum antarcticum]SDW70492.1 hypothetical protein SAMN04488238_103141 [Roseicitreum antarcticum]
MTVFDTVKHGVLAAALVAGSAGVAWADGPVSAVEFGAELEGYGAERVTWQFDASAMEPAAAFVRGCEGFVPAEGAGMAIALLNPREALHFTADGEDLAGMVLGTPDGLYRCVLAEDGLAQLDAGPAQPGRYSLWPAVATEGGPVSARVIASESMISAVEMRGLDMASLGAPRLGRFRFDAQTAEAQLIGSGVLVAETAADFLSPDYCAGLIGLDAPDATVVVDAGTGAFSLYATTPGDGVIAIYTPSGRWVCNDDMQGLNPGMTFDAPEAGDYLVWVGSLYEGGAETFELSARLGTPDWGLVTPDADAEPRYGYVTLVPAQAESAQLLARGDLAAYSAAETLSPDQFCNGYVNPDGPEMVLSLDGDTASFSLFADSDVDLVMAVRDPAGLWHCSDDAMGSNPALTFDAGMAGEYTIFVGAFSEASQGRFELFVSMGAPEWTALPPAAMDDISVPDSFFDVTLGLDAAPTHGTVNFPEMADARVPFEILPNGDDYFGLGQGCVGRGATAQPDLVVEVAEGAAALTIYAVAEADSTLIVVDPSGTMHCSDDLEGANPGLSFSAAEPGAYRVFAGTYGGQGSAAILGVTAGTPDWTMTPGR